MFFFSCLRSHCDFICFIYFWFFFSFCITRHSIRTSEGIFFKLHSTRLEYFLVKKAELYVNQMTYNHQSKTSCCLKKKLLNDKIGTVKLEAKRNCVLRDWTQANSLQCVLSIWNLQNVSLANCITYWNSAPQPLLPAPWRPLLLPLSPIIQHTQLKT